MNRLLSLTALAISSLLASVAAGQGYVDMRANNSALSFYPAAPSPYSNQNYSATSFYGMNNLRYGASFQGHRNFLEDSYTNNGMTRFYRDTVSATDVTNGMSSPGPVRPYYNPSSMVSNGATINTSPAFKPADPFGLLPSAFNTQAFVSNTNYGRRLNPTSPLYLGPATDAQGRPILQGSENQGLLPSTNGTNQNQDQTGRLFAPTLPLTLPPPSIFSPQITFYSAAEAGMKPQANPTGRIMPLTPGTTTPSQEPEFQNEPEQPAPWMLMPNGQAPSGALQNGNFPTKGSNFGPVLPHNNEYVPDYFDQYLPSGKTRAPNGAKPSGPAAGQPAAPGGETAVKEAKEPKETQVGPAKPKPVGEQYYQLAMIDLQAGAYRPAAEAFDQVVQFEPALKFQAERGQGLARMLSSDYHAAAHLLAKNLINQPDATSALFRVGSLVDRQKDWDAADADLTAILKDSPASADHAFALAYLRIFSGRPQGLDAYLRTAEKNPDLAPAVKILRARIQQ